MSYAPNGMLTGATVNSSGWAHTYDDLGRLLTSVNGSTVSYSFNYDRYGNRFNQTLDSGAGNAAYTPADNTTNKVASGHGVSHDALGNITNDGSHSYTYDAENRITQVDSGTTATYLYDAFNRRVQRTTGGTTYNYTYDLDDNVAMVYSGTSTPLTVVRAELFLGSTHFATYTPSHTYFHHQNGLGSRATTTDESGAAVQNCEWYPFGDLKACADLRAGQTAYNTPDAFTPYGYAAYERDSETGFDHMQFRYYNSRIGRFLSADVLSGDGDDPQTLNLFGYVGNNPLNWVDPFGPQAGCPAEHESCGNGGTGEVPLAVGDGLGGGFWGPACRLDGIDVPCYVLSAMRGDSVNIVTFETPPCPSTAFATGCSPVRWQDGEWQEKVFHKRKSECPRGYVCNTGAWTWEMMKDSAGMHTCGDFVCDFWERQRGWAPNEVIGLSSDTTVNLAIAGVVKNAANGVRAVLYLANNNRYLRIGVGNHGGYWVLRVGGNLLTRFMKNPHIDIMRLGKQ